MIGESANLIICDKAAYFYIIGIYFTQSVSLTRSNDHLIESTVYRVYLRHHDIGILHIAYELTTGQVTDVAYSSTSNSIVAAPYIHTVNQCAHGYGAFHMTVSCHFISIYTKQERI